jgi:hypothetical protein
MGGWVDAEARGEGEGALCTDQQQSTGVHRAVRLAAGFVLRCGGSSSDEDEDEELDEDEDEDEDEDDSDDDAADDSDSDDSDDAEEPDDDEPDDSDDDDEESDDDDDDDTSDVTASRLRVAAGTLALGPAGLDAGDSCWRNAASWARSRASFPSRLCPCRAALWPVSPISLNTRSSIATALKLSSSSLLEEEEDDDDDEDELAADDEDDDAFTARSLLSRFATPPDTNLDLRLDVLISRRPLPEATAGLAPLAAGRLPRPLV